MEPPGPSSSTTAAPRGELTAAGRSGLAAELGKSSGFDSIEQEVYLNLLRTTTWLSSEFDRLFKSRGLSQPKYNALRILRGHRADEGSGIRSQRIVDDLVTPEPDITRLLERLERDGLVERGRSSEDRRVVLVRLTAKGRGLVDALDEDVLRLHREQLGHLPEAELEALNRLLFDARERVSTDQPSADLDE